MIIVGSASDLKVAEKAINILETLKIPYSLKVASAHRTYEKVKKIVIESTKKGIEVFIGIAGLAAHLPGSIAAYTHKPVIGVPVDVKLGGLDAIYASSQMPFPVPVATVGIDRGDNGAILAGQIIGINDEKVRDRVSKLRISYQNKVKEDEKKLIKHFSGKFFKKEFIDNISVYDENKNETGFEGKYEIVSNEKYDKKNSPLVSIIPGSYSDIEIAKKASMVLEKLNISFDINVISPIRYPNKFQKYMESMKDVKLFLAVSGLSAHVTGSIVALTEKPVIGVPCSIQLNGMDSLLSMINMPPGVPVGTVGIGNGRNGGILAGEILGISDNNIENDLKKLKCKSSDS